MVRRIDKHTACQVFLYTGKPVTQHVLMVPELATLAGAGVRVRVWAALHTVPSQPDHSGSVWCCQLVPQSPISSLLTQR